MAMMASRKISTCWTESPDSSRCSDLRQTASYSIARGTLSNSVACRCRTARIMAADAPAGLRIAATTASVSITSLTSPTISHYGRCHSASRYFRSTRPWGNKKKRLTPASGFVNIDIGYYFLCFASLEHAHSAGLLQPQAVRVLLRAGAPGAPEPDRLLEPAGRAHGRPPNAAEAPTGRSPHHHLGQPAILSRRADRMGAPAARDRALRRQREDPFRPAIVRASGHHQRGRSDGPARGGAGRDVPSLLRTRHRPVPRAAAAATQRHLPAAPSLRRGLAEHPRPGGRADRLRAHRQGDRRVAGPLRRALPCARPIRTGRRAGAVPNRSGLARGSVGAVPLPHSGGGSQ